MKGVLMISVITRAS